MENVWVDIVVEVIVMYMQMGRRGVLVLRMIQGDCEGLYVHD